MNVDPETLNHFLMGDAGGIMYAIRQADIAGKIILVLLLFISSISWSVMITKFRQLRRARNSSEIFLKRVRGERNFFSLFNQRVRLEGCPVNEVYTAGCRELSLNERGEGTLGELGGPVIETSEKLTNLQVDRIKEIMGRTVAEEAMKLEAGVTVLGTVVSSAPFIGLLGTVWGVMDAFTGVAISQSTSIGALAPGVASALLTTIVGLIVAIPSMVGYNILLSDIRHLTVTMDNFAGEFVTNVEKKYLEQR